jgi:cytochrome c peroxidase
VRPWASAIITVLLGFGAVAAAGPVVPLGLDLYRPGPADDPPTPGKVALGRRLFRDRRLSANGTLSCAGCHDPGRAFTSRGTGASRVGAIVVTRDVPTLLNRTWGVTFFWDGRAASLEAQVLEPILNPHELGLTEGRLLDVVRSTPYRARFEAVFGTEATTAHVARALAAYVRTILAGNSPFDRHNAGDTSALGEPARRGLRLFMGKAGCSGCHAGPNLTDERFHNTGVAWRTGWAADRGRANVTGRPVDVGAFKTPTLRQVQVTAPYMHDGSLASLDRVVDYYDRGGQPNPGLDSRLRRLHLRPVEKRDLVAFLVALTGEVWEGRLTDGTERSIVPVGIRAAVLRENSTP